VLSIVAVKPREPFLRYFQTADELAHWSSEREERETVEARVVALRREQAGARRSMDRYFAAFEAWMMKPSACHERLDGLEARLDTLIAEEQALVTQKDAETPPTRNWWPSGP
jgi:hypothetical protein